MWQDYVIAATVLMFTLTTVPMIVRGTRLPILTAAPMFLGSSLLVIAYSTLELWYSAGVEVFAMAAWTILFRISVQGRV